MRRQDWSVGQGGRGALTAPQDQPEWLSPAGDLPDQVLLSNVIISVSTKVTIRNTTVNATTILSFVAVHHCATQYGIKGSKSNVVSTVLTRRKIG
jgi:hypothetical protein